MTYLSMETITFVGCLLEVVNNYSLKYTKVLTLAVVLSGGSPQVT